MNDEHSACRRATWSLNVWRCASCRERLGWTTQGHRRHVKLRGELVPANVQHGNLPTFGLSKARLGAGGSVANWTRAGMLSGAKDRRLVPLPAAVYCPRRGVCGVLQHLDLEAIGAKLG